MQVMQITKEKAMEHSNMPTKVTNEKLQREFDFYMAEYIAKSMLDKGIISKDECTKLSAENRRFFSPYLSELC